MSQSALHLVIVSTLPSPYQRDLFDALSQDPDVELSVRYLEGTAPDSPWPEQPLRQYESILPGFCLGRGRIRSHINLYTGVARHAHALIVNAALTDLTTQLAMRLASSRSIPWWFFAERLRDHPDGWQGAVHRILCKPLESAAGIFAIGSLAAQQYHSRFPGLPVTNLPYHTDLSPFLSIPQRVRHTPTTFLFCGQMIPRKGFDVLLDAFALLHERQPAAQLILAGRTTPLALELLSQLPPKTRRAIDLKGFVPPDQLPPLFAEAQAFVLPSRHDGWGVAVNQALAAGLPVLATPAVGSAVDLVSPECGRLVPPGDSLALAEAMAWIYDPATPLAMLSRQARLQVSHLTPLNGAARIASTISAALVTRHPPSDD
jgi:poly(glycerol-phosphate) alpha-glucosyltransferase